MEERQSRGGFRFTLRTMFALLTVLGLCLTVFAYPFARGVAIVLMYVLSEHLPGIALTLGLWFGALGLFFWFLRYWTRTVD